MHTHPFVVTDTDYGLVLINREYDKTKHTATVWTLSFFAAFLASVLVAPIFSSTWFTAPVAFFGGFLLVWMVRTLESNPQSFVGKILTSGNLLPRGQLHAEFLHKYFVLLDDRQMNFPDHTQAHRAIVELVELAAAVNAAAESDVLVYSVEQTKELFRDYAGILRAFTDDFGAAIPTHLVDHFIDLVDKDTATVSAALESYSSAELLRRRAQAQGARADRVSRRFSKQQAAAFEYEQMFDILDDKQNAREK